MIKVYTKQGSSGKYWHDLGDSKVYSNGEWHYIKCTDKIFLNGKWHEIGSSVNPLTFTSYLTGGTVSLIASSAAAESSNVDMYYRKNYGEWKPYTLGTGIVGGGDLFNERGSVIQFWNKTNTLSSLSDGKIRMFYFKISGYFKLSGNVCSLINYSPYVPEYCFYGLFEGQSISVENFEINVSSVRAHGMDRMFADTKEDLYNKGHFRIEADYPGYESFRSMFENSTAITHVDLMVTLKRDCTDCFYQLFYNSSVKSVRVGFTDWLSRDPGDSGGGVTTTRWMNGVSETGTFYKPTALEAWYDDGYGIPEGWTVVNE